jgi:biotin transport system permease protein
MIALYRDGNSLLHRAPAGAKVLAFMVIALAITLSADNPFTVPVAVALAIFGYLTAGLGLRTLVAQIYVVRWVIVIMLVTQLIFLPPLVAAANTGRVLAVIVLAALITLTTRIPALLDATEHALGPLRRFGADPARIGLLLGMTITTIPVIMGIATTIRDAQRARGVPVRPATFVMPLLILSLKHSDDLADALAARGID